MCIFSTADGVEQRVGNGLQLIEHSTADEGCCIYFVNVVWKKKPEYRHWIMKSIYYARWCSHLSKWLNFNHYKINKIEVPDLPPDWFQLKAWRYFTLMFALHLKHHVLQHSIQSHYPLQSNRCIFRDQRQIFSASALHKLQTVSRVQHFIMYTECSKYCYLLGWLMPCSPEWMTWLCDFSV